MSHYLFSTCRVSQPLRVEITGLAKGTKHLVRRGDKLFLASMKLAMEIGYCAGMPYPIICKTCSEFEYLATIDEHFDRVLNVMWYPGGK